MTFVQKFLLIFLLGASLHAQTTATPTVSFNVDDAIVPPDHYSIAVASDGSTTYESTDKGKKDVEALDPYQLKFTMSPPTLKKIFALTEAANHFHGNFAFKGKVAHTGTKTLRYTDQNLDLKQTYLVDDVFQPRGRNLAAAAVSETLRQALCGCRAEKLGKPCRIRRRLRVAYHRPAVTKHNK